MTTTKFLVKQYLEFCNKNNIHIQTHQIYGVLWCIRKERSNNIFVTNKWKGGILADDMGMGKTIQMIATILLNFKKKTLILLPPILIQQWYSEILKILGHSSVLYHGSNKKNINSYKKLEKATIVITSYDTFLCSPELLEISWDRTICDEAHRLRNPKTKLYKYIQYRLQTNILWCITGTPIHNKIGDILSLFSLFALDPKSIKKNSLPEDMVLRRTKNANIILPEKKEFKQMIQWKMNSGEWKLAKDIHLSIGGVFGGGGIGVEEVESFWKTKNINDLVTMIRAKQLCILPKLLEKPVLQLEYDEPDDLFPEQLKNTTLQNTSCKIKAILQHILSPTRVGRGKIIFCHFQLEMTKITELLREKNKDNNNYWIGNWKEFLLRQRKCNNNNDDDTNKVPPILILQIRSGCEGLNLQNDFSEVYFVSPNWNPTLEDQAIARCHRIGQQKEVFVYRFYMDQLLANEEEMIMEKKHTKNIITYFWIIKYIPDDIKRYIDEFLVNDIAVVPFTFSKYSMDLYTLYKQNEKREKINEFMKQITI